MEHPPLPSHPSKDPVKPNEFPDGTCSGPSGLKSGAQHPHEDDFARLVPANFITRKAFSLSVSTMLANESGFEVWVMTID